LGRCGGRSNTRTDCAATDQDGLRRGCGEYAFGRQPAEGRGR
jgi:hypothetical protein